MMKNIFRIHISFPRFPFRKKSEFRAMLGRSRLFFTMFMPFILLVLCACIVLSGFQRWHRLDLEAMQLYNRLSRITAYQAIAKDNPLAGPVISGDSKNVDLANVLLAIQQLANTLGVSIENIKPNEGVKAIAKSASYTATPIELSVYCQEPSLARFIVGLEKCKFLARINSMSVSPDAKNEGVVRSHIRIEKIDLV